MAKNDVIGLAMELDVADLKAGINEVNKMIKTSKDEFAHATAGMEKWSKSSEGLTAKLSQLEKQLDAQKKLVAGYQAEIKRVSELEGDHSEELKNLESKLLKAQTQVAKTEKEISKYGTSLSQVSKEEKEANSELGKLTRTISEQENELSQLKKEYQNAVLTYGKNSKEAKSLAKQYDNLSSELSENKKRLNESDRALEQTDNAMEDLQKEVKETKKETSNFGDMLKANLVSDAIVGGIKLLGSAVKEVGKALKDSIVSSAAFADEILTLSTQTGLSTDKLQEFEYMAGLIDVDVGTITGSMAKLTKNMATASKGTGDGAKAFQSLGVNIKNADGTLRSNQDVFNDTITALGKMENETQRDAYAMQIFGKSAQELNPLIAQGGDALAKFSEEAHNTGYVLDEEALSSLGAVDDSFQRFGKSIEGTKNQLMSKFAPAISEMVNSITPFISTIGKGLSGMMDGTEGASGEVAEGVKGIVNVFTTQFQNIIPKVQSIVAKIIPSLINGLIANIPTLLTNTTNFILQIITHLTNALPQIVQTLTTVIPLLVTALSESLPQIITAIAQMFPIVVSSVTELLPTIISAILTLIPMIVDSLMQNIPIVLQASIDLLMAIIDAIPIIIAQLIPMLPQIIDTVLNGVLNAIPQLLNGAIKLFNAIIEAIPIIIKVLIKELPKIISTIISALLNALPDIIKGAVELFMGIIKAIPTIIKELVKAVPDIIVAIVKGLKDGFADIKDVGTELVKGLWEGIKDMTSWVVDKIKGFGDSVLGGIKKFFGIKSPSKEMEKIGKYLDEGLAQGVEKNKKKVTKATDSMGKDILKSVEGIEKQLEQSKINEKILALGGQVKNPFDSWSNAELNKEINVLEKKLKDVNSQLIENGVTQEQWNTSSEKMNDRARILEDRLRTQNDLMNLFNAKIKMYNDNEVPKWVTEGIEELKKGIETTTQEARELNKVIKEEGCQSTESFIDKIEEATKKMGEGFEGASSDVAKSFEGIKKALKPIVDVVKDMYHQIMDIIDMALDLQMQELDAQLRELEENTNKEVELKEEATEKEIDELDELLKKNIITYEEYTQRKEMLEKDLADAKEQIEDEAFAKEKEINAQKNEIAKKQFNAQKFNDIAQATINGALAITKLYTMFDPVTASIMAVVQAGLTATQIALISKQKFVPMFAKGGVVENPTLAMIGEAGKEVVMPLENNTGWIRELAEKLKSFMQTDFSFNSRNDLIPAYAGAMSTVNNFTQVINSPKLPSRIDIYRDTKNLLALKGK